MHNRALLQRLTALMPERSIVPTDHYGISGDAVEAITFAWLAKCRLDEVTANLPAVTGASRPVMLGAIYRS
jgi:anhydro-N-acetylmuramic acid kinase